MPSDLHSLQPNRREQRLTQIARGRRPGAAPKQPAVLPSPALHPAGLRFAVRFSGQFLGAPLARYAGAERGPATPPVSLSNKATERKKKK